MKGSGPDGIEIDFETADRLFLAIDGLDQDKLLSEVILVEHKIEEMFDFPLNDFKTTYTFWVESTVLEGQRYLSTC